jgi:hypothetical protein
MNSIYNKQQTTTIQFKERNPFFTFHNLASKNPNVERKKERKKGEEGRKEGRRIKTKTKELKRKE